MTGSGRSAGLADPVARPTDQRPVAPWAWTDGALVPTSSLVSPVQCSGLQYAAVAFEGVRAYHGRLWQAREHAERLLRSARRLGVEPALGAEAVVAGCSELVAKLGGGDWYLRPTVWDAGGSLRLAAAAADARVAILATRVPSVLTRSRPLGRRGLRVRVSGWRRAGAPFVAEGVKGSAGYAVSALALREARSLGFDDALLLDGDGLVCELSTANVFVVSAGELSTPHPGPALAGLTRSHLIELASTLGISVSERAVSVDDLAQADELFACGTAVELRPIVEVAETHRWHVQPGPVTRALTAAFRDSVLGGRG